MDPAHDHQDLPQLTPSIRAATQADIPGLAALHLASWRHAYRDIVPDAWLESVSLESRLARWTDGLARDPSLRQTFVADDGGALLGLCDVGLARDEDAGPACGEVVALHVQPDLQGRGVGTSLLAVGMERIGMQGCRSAMLWVLAANAPARMFYERRGWRPDGATKVELRGTARIPEVRYRTRIISRTIE